MAKTKIVFLGGKSIGAYCFRHLLDNALAYNSTVIAIATKSNAALDANETVLDLANKINIPVLKDLENLPDCDFIISVQYHDILKQRHIDKANTLAINLHMAPLPEYRGCNQFSFAIVDDKKVFGTTLHVMTAGIDDGDILAERRFDIEEDIWVEDLLSYTVEESKLLFAENIEKILLGDYESISQASLEKERGTSYHFRKEIKNLKLIDESWSKEKKKKHVRATFMTGFEPPYSIVDGEKKYYDKSSF